ncbi:MAG: polyprenyl synthetase family protein [Deltaproteobacteria bacterium]|nr:polyprenyl synthetase family protein [Deltaproteobacteria bacterium]
MFDLKTYLNQKQNQINEAIRQILQGHPSQRIVEAMTYSVMAGGKRLRPILCMAAAEAVGGDSHDVIPAGCAIEMIHTYSLIHDDLPAMDDDDLRRGKPTCHVAFDEATALLAGDALLTLAFQVLSSLDSNEHFPASKRLEIIHIISVAAGYNGMIEGQMRDMASEGIHLGTEELKELHARKTGALIEASTRSGAVLGGGTPHQIEKLSSYARCIGLAFQVRDDVLNVEGDPAVMGKAVGTDDSRDKNTFPSLIGLEQSKVYAESLVNNALKEINDFDNKADPLRAIAGYIIERNK